MLKRHDLSVFCDGSGLQIGWERLLRRKGMVACHRDLRRQILKEGAGWGELCQGGFPVHQGLCIPDGSAEGFANGLVPQTDA